MQFQLDSYDQILAFCLQLQLEECLQYVCSLYEFVNIL